MIETKSVVLMNRLDFNNPLIDSCKAAEKAGGYFSINNKFLNGDWVTEYVISWPDNIAPAKEAL